MADSYQLIAILGPTASGKSAVALALARRIGAEILSVDSMQVYRGMDIGTAKPSHAERQEIPHHLLDVVAPTETFTVARFVECADAVIADAARRRVPLIATGGTPLYFKALFEGLFDGPSADAELRTELKQQSGEALWAELNRIDAAAAQRIHANDTKRLIRALEIFRLTGRPISELQSQWSGAEPRHRAIWFGLEWERSALNQRINTRARQMLDAGWLDETRRLLADYGVVSKTAAEATGYAELIEHLQGRLSLEDAIERIKIATRQLARRQIKWIRRFPRVGWVRGERSSDEIAAEIHATWEAEIRNPKSEIRMKPE
jgi:tRNA dimethylallyltransferase